MLRAMFKLGGRLRIMFKPEEGRGLRGESHVQVEVRG